MQNPESTRWTRLFFFAINTKMLTKIFKEKDQQTISNLLENKYAMMFWFVHSMAMMKNGEMVYQLLAMILRV